MEALHPKIVWTLLSNTYREQVNITGVCFGPGVRLMQ